MRASSSGRAVLVALVVGVLGLVAGCSILGPGVQPPPGEVGESVGRPVTASVAEVTVAATTPVPYPTRTPLSLGPIAPPAPSSADPSADPLDQLAKPELALTATSPAMVPIDLLVGSVTLESDPVASSPGSSALDSAATRDGNADAVHNPAEVALTRVPDTDPAPPLTVVVDSVKRLAGGTGYQVAGIIRNEGDVMYEGIGAEATFYDGSPWHHGPFDAKVGCHTLLPGQSCAFTVEAYARRYTSYRLHPEGSPVKAWTGSSAPLAVSGIEATGPTAGYVRLAGVVCNDTPTVVETVRVSGSLLDVNGRVAGVASAVVCDRLEPGERSVFNLLITAATYTSVRVTGEGQLR